ncbi:hypothetical protein [Halalkalibacterium halodurans]|uniref:hypothetical protein n=1 Tax=Halalkalibacterium halodurans TaxID=86665 RepID=UPI002AA9C489|nr:hypothetical protein [Halalkalibacterium halodurans]MDY7223416.1 hypothetical protein [Halalkalibacterium halodurans]MDY7242637.1 hypothetical protein [Halalkalibacterium halodurans]
MYVTLKKLSDYLELPEAYLENQIQAGHVKAYFIDGTYVVNQASFAWYKEQLDKKREESRREEQELPEDWDAKDED